MAEPIVSRAKVCQHADEAARISVQTQQLQTNPYPVGSDAAAAWKVCFERYLLLHSTGEVSA